LENRGGSCLPAVCFDVANRNGFFGERCREYSVAFFCADVLQLLKKYSQDCVVDGNLQPNRFYFYRNDYAAIHDVLFFNADFRRSFFAHEKF
jgi:hypothetical protein